MTAFLVKKELISVGEGACFCERCCCLREVGDSVESDLLEEDGREKEKRDDFGGLRESFDVLDICLLGERASGSASGVRGLGGGSRDNCR